MRAIAGSEAILRPTFSWFLCLFTVVYLAACASGPEPVASRTGGVALELFVRTPDHRQMLYRVEKDGTLRFAGGPDAMARTFTWSGPMSDSETAAFAALIDADGWIDGPGRSTGEPPGLVYRIEIDGPACRRRHRLEGSCAAVDRMVGLLDPIALRRLEGELERLPRPSVEKQLDPGDRPSGGG